MQSDLHPMALGLVVAELGWGPLAGVRAERDNDPHEEGEEAYGRNSGERRGGGKRPWEIGKGGRGRGRLALVLPLRHCRSVDLLPAKSDTVIYLRISHFKWAGTGRVLFWIQNWYRKMFASQLFKDKRRDS